jgi:hypothetical protein
MAHAPSELEDERDDEPEGASSLFVLPASRAPVAAVFLRVPGHWWHVLAWDLSRGTLEPGAWLKGTLYPRRSDVSPNGRLLCYFLAKEGKGAFMGMHDRHVFTAVSKLPWVTALAAWPEPDTDTAGHHFASPPRLDLGPTRHGGRGPLGHEIGLARTGPAQYAAELRRGWVEHPDCPPRHPHDDWDEERSVVLVKARPGGGASLVLSDEGWDPDAPGAIDGRAPSYAVERDGRTEALDDVVWADWDQTGLLLVATDTSRLEVRDPFGSGPPIWAEDLGGRTPRPRPAPDWAQRW